jgi:type IV pilus assembly protein PilE
MYLMTTRSSLHPRRRQGFTLIELMITVGIVATLAAIAVPAYQSQIRKSRRTEARTALLDLAGRAERLYSITNIYWGSTVPNQLVPADVGYTGTAWPITLSDGYYSIGLSNNNTGAAFKFTATASGAQATDTQCATLSVDNTGNQSASDPACWN